MANSVPYVLTNNSRDWSWLDGFSWPANPKDMLRVNERVIARFNAYADSLEGDDRRTVLLARGTNEAATLIEAAHIANAPGASRIAFPVLDWIRSGDAAQQDLRSHLKRMGDRFRLTRIPFSKIRQVLRTYSWSGLPGLLPAVLSTEILAITHNPLLVAEAKRAKARMPFRHAELMFGAYMSARAGSAGGGNVERLSHLAAGLTSALLADENLDEQTRINVEGLFRPYCHALISDAARALDALKYADDLPPVLWTGNGSYYSSRAIGLEVLRRGGVVRRFDHGGTASLMQCDDYLISQELAVSSEFVVPTGLAASLPAINKAAFRVPRGQAVRILGGHGDPSLKPRRSTARKKAGGRPKVMFVGTAYYGFYQSMPPFLPAPLYLDWQRRVLSLLEEFDIDLVHKPHPGGIFMGCPPPLKDSAPLEVRNFEESSDDVDVFVFDFAASTTFSVALSSEKPIVLLDFGSLIFQPEIRQAIDRRCSVVNVEVDRENRLTVNREALRHAVCSVQDRPDPAYFRQLFLGESV